MTNRSHPSSRSANPVVVIAAIGVVLFLALDMLERHAVFQREAAK